MTFKPVVLPPDVDLSTTKIDLHVTPECWASACTRPTEVVLRTLQHYYDLSFISEVGYCRYCVGWFSDNWLRYPQHTFPLGYYVLAKVHDSEGDDW